MKFVISPICTESKAMKKSLEWKRAYVIVYPKRISEISSPISTCPTTGSVALFIFPRLALAKELRICEERVTAAFRELVQPKLVWEKCCGLGQANQIYLAKVDREGF